MWKIRILLGAIVAAFLVWSGWWWLGARGHETAIEAWLADRRAAGWAADAAEVSVVGYPFRFDMTARDLALSDPAAGWAWTTPEFRSYMLAYQPNKVIVEWPATQTVAAPGERVEVRSQRMRASAAFAPNASLALERAIVELKGIELVSANGWTSGLERGQFSIRRSEEERGRANAYDAVLEGDGVRPTEALRRLLSGGGARLPETLEALRIDVTAAFSRPLDRRALDDSDIRPEAIWLRPSRLKWGALELEAKGRVNVAPDGELDGAVTLTARNWREMLDMATAAGALDAGAAEAARSALGLLAMLSGGDTLVAPLRFSGGTMYLGPAPIGPAPRL